MQPIPNGIALYAFEFGALYPLQVKSVAGWGGTLGYADRTHGPVPLSSEVEVRYGDKENWDTANDYAKSLEHQGYKVLVIKGMPALSEVGV